MPLLSLPDECFSNVLSFLDDHTLYNCLFVGRHWCRLSVPMVWSNPFQSKPKPSLINTLLACLDEDEISSLIPCAINFSNQFPLFEYGKFVKIINHGYFAYGIMTWLKSSSKTDDCRIQKLINAIYHMFMRQGSNLQEFNLSFYDSRLKHIDLPKYSVFTTYEPGITNLKSLIIGDVYNQNTIEFLSEVSKFRDSIIRCELYISEHGVFVKPLLDIFKSQPLEEITLSLSFEDQKSIKEFICFLEFRSETLKELSFSCQNFEGIGLSFILKLERLERLEFYKCYGFAIENYESLLSEKKFHLKELKLWGSKIFNVFPKAMINFLCGETLLKLSLNIVIPETIKAVKESCPNIIFLHVRIDSAVHLDQIVRLICELSALKILDIEPSWFYEGAHRGLLKILGDHLTSVECLSFSFIYSGDLLSFKYFIDNCKANLKKWRIGFYSKDLLLYVNNYQKVHNSLKVLGLYGLNEIIWSSNELEIVDSLKNQGVDIVPSNELFFTHNK